MITIQVSKESSKRVTVGLATSPSADTTAIKGMLVGSGVATAADRRSAAATAIDATVRKILDEVIVGYWS